MNRIVNIVSSIIGLLFCSCSYSYYEDKPYSIDWQDNNLCVIMPHPTVGIVTPGQISWSGVELSEVIENIYEELQKTRLSGSVSVWVRFEMQEHDKYGNEVMSYDDHLLTEIAVIEAKKYKSGIYLDREYNLTNLISQSAFPIKFQTFDADLEALRNAFFRFLI